MSSFYYCNDCKKAVDLVGVILRHPHNPIDPSMAKEVYECKECGGLNWKAIIDTPSGEKEKK